MKTLRPHQAEATKIIAGSIEGIINLPTGTGKTMIQAHAIIDDILANTIQEVYVVLSPRILLSNQLFEEIRTELAMNGVDAQYLVVHSGNQGDMNNKEWDKLRTEQGFEHRDVLNTVSHIDIKRVYGKASRQNVPLIISCTYDSAEKIRLSGIPVKVLHCDEAHNLVTTEFAGIPTSFPAKRKFYYTATMRVTNGNSFGMNNAAVFGNILYQKRPVDMIEAGEIVRPRMHLVNIPNIEGGRENDIDAAAVKSAFIEHQGLINVGAKLLVVAKGSEHLDGLAAHEEIRNLRTTYPGLRVFDISSAYEPRINGEVVNRRVFLRTMKDMKDEDQAIIIHVRILTEGIDVPGITGVMPLNNLEKAAFLQTLGRATRLHRDDRERLYDGSIKSGDLDQFIKPYAWVIIPTYTQLGREIEANISNMVRELRTFGFDPNQDVFISTSRGAAEPANMDAQNELDESGRTNREFFGDIDNEIEDEELAYRLMLINMDFAKNKDTIADDDIFDF